VGTESVFLYLYRKKLDPAVNQKCHCKERGYWYEVWLFTNRTSFKTRFH